MFAVKIMHIVTVLAILALVLTGCAPAAAPAGAAITASPSDDQVRTIDENLAEYERLLAVEVGKSQEELKSAQEELLNLLENDSGQNLPSDQSLLPLIATSDWAIPYLANYLDMAPDDFAVAKNSALERYIYSIGEKQLTPEQQKWLPFLAANYRVQTFLDDPLTADLVDSYRDGDIDWTEYVHDYVNILENNQIIAPDLAPTFRDLEPCPSDASGIDLPIMVPDFQIPGGAPIVVPGFQIPGGAPIVVPGFQIPGGAPIAVPGFQIPGGAPIAVPDFQIPGGAPIVVPGFQIPGGAPIAVPDFQIPNGGTKVDAFEPFSIPLYPCLPDPKDPLTPLPTPCLECYEYPGKPGTDSITSSYRPNQPTFGPPGPIIIHNPAVVAGCSPYLKVILTEKAYVEVWQGQFLMDSQEVSANDEYKWCGPFDRATVRTDGEFVWESDLEIERS